MVLNCAAPGILRFPGIVSFLVHSWITFRVWRLYFRTCCQKKTARALELCLCTLPFLPPPTAKQKPNGKIFLLSAPPHHVLLLGW